MAFSLFARIDCGPDVAMVNLGIRREESADLAAGARLS